MTFSQSLHGLITGKRFLMQILVNLLKSAILKKKRIQVHPTISLNNVQVERLSYQKHLGILLDGKQHIVSAISKVHKGISGIKKLRHNLERKSLVTIYKAFLRMLTDYGEKLFVKK